MTKRRFPVLPLIAAAGLAALILARTDDPIPPAGNPDWAAPGAFSRIRSDRPDFEPLFGLIRSTLRANQARFKTPSGWVRGFAAGSAYPQMWIRDAATIMPAARFFYGRPYIQGAIFEHLARQDPDGGIADWFDANGTIDKNTTESDQETSLVLAAGQAADLLGGDWLRQTIGGIGILERLEKGLFFVLRERFDPGLGLVKGAHTIDWGDVEMGEADQGAIRFGPDSHWTAGIYNQSQFYAACLELAELWRAAERPDRAAPWLERAASVRAAADRHLWLDARGYYRVHIHVTPLAHGFDEDAMFAMGGNAEAVLSGLASPEKSRRIFEAAAARRRDLKIDTISGVLLPPYPAKTFAHHLVDDPFEYQNGGQWDWFGGKLLLAMYREGAAETATSELLAVARKNVRNGGLFEWDTPDGKGRGSARFSGSAGSLARALIEGYFGIALDAAGLALTPRLGADSGAVHVFLPASGRYVGYDHLFNEETRSLTLTYASDWAEAGTLRILWPARGRDSQTIAIPERFDVRRDGLTIPFTKETIGSDTYIRVATDWRRHELHIRPAH